MAAIAAAGAFAAGHGPDDAAIHSSVTVEVPERRKSPRFLLSASYTDAQVRDIDARLGLLTQPNPTSVKLTEHLDRSGTGGPVFEANFPDGQVVRLLGVSSMDPAHAQSWAADGTPLLAQLPFRWTQGYPHHVITSGSGTTADGKIYGIHSSDSANYVRQFLLELHDVGSTLWPDISESARQAYNGRLGLKVAIDPNVAAYVNSRDPNFNPYGHGTLFALEESFEAGTRTTELKVGFYGHPALFESIQVLNGVLHPKTPQVWTLNSGKGFDNGHFKGIESKIAPQDTVCVLDWNSLKSPGQDAFEITAISKSGSPIELISLGAMVTPNGPILSACQPSGIPWTLRYRGWQLKHVKLQDVARIDASRTPVLHAEFKNVQLNPKP